MWSSVLGSILSVEGRYYFKDSFKWCFREEATHYATGELSSWENDSEIENLEKIDKVIKKLLQYLLSHIAKRKTQTVKRKERKKQSSHFRGKN